MKRLIVLFVVFTSIIFPQVTSDINITEIESGVWQIEHKFPWAANSLIVDCGENEFLWIDTPYTEEATADVYFWLTMKFGEVKLTEINTGFHIDNLGGNGFLVEKGIPVYGSTLTSKLVEERGDSTQQQMLDWLKGPKNKRFFLTYKNFKFTKPNRLFDINEGLNIQVGDQNVEVWFPGESHSPDNLVVYLPDKKLLFGGCMVKSVNSRTPGFTGDANMLEWAPSLKRVLTKYADAKLVVPGHGSPGGLELITHTIGLLGK